MGVISPQSKHTREYFNTGTIALDGSNPTVVTTTFSVITACGATVQGSTVPGVGTEGVQTVKANVDGASTVSIYAFKVTSSSDTTKIASTGTETIDWWATGY